MLFWHNHNIIVIHRCFADINMPNVAFVLNLLYNRYKFELLRFNTGFVELVYEKMFCVKIKSNGNNFGIAEDDLCWD